MFKELFSLDKNGNFKHWTISVNGDTITVGHGRLGGKMVYKDTICKPKNVGKSNETTSEEQALLEAESKINKQIDKCYRWTKEEAKEVGQLLPMLAQNFLQNEHRIKFPCYVSTKLDGVRCIASVHLVDKEYTVKLTSRGGKDYECPDHIKRDLVELYIKTNIDKFDGELYIHGMPLQNIISCVKKHNQDTISLEFHIFDIPVEGIKWEQRFSNMLKKVQDSCKRLGSIQVVDNILVNDKESASFLLDTFIKKGYEGLILRNIDGLYTFNNRSPDLQKWKLMKDAEALVLSVSEDKNGEGVLSCEMPNSKKIFKCKMKGTHEERLVDNQKELIGKWITYSYQTLTEEGLPQFPVGLYVRTCDRNGEPTE